MDGFPSFWTEDDHLWKIMPNLLKFRQTGAHVKYVNPSFPSSTLVNFHTIQTGVPPTQHGVVNNNIYDPSTKQLMKKSSKFYFGYSTKFEPLWYSNEKKNSNRHSGMFSFPGGEVEFPSSNNKTILPSHFFKYQHEYSSWTFDQWRSQLTTVLSWFASHHDPVNLAMFYTIFPDFNEHPYGNNFSEIHIKSSLEKMDILIGDMMEFNKKSKLNLNIIILSDHGMQAVDDYIILSEYIDEEEFVIAGTGVLVGVWPKDVAIHSIEELYEELKKIEKLQEKTEIYLRENFPKKFHYSNNERIAPLLIVGKNGKYLKLKENETDSHGLHGYLVDDVPQMRTILFANGPDIRKNDFLVPGPWSHYDSHLLFLKILQLPNQFNRLGSNEKISQILQPIYLKFGNLVLLAIIVVSLSISSVISITACCVPIRENYHAIPIDGSAADEAVRDRLLSSDGEEDIVLTMTKI